MSVGSPSPETSGAPSQKHLFMNTVWSWVGQLVFIAGGFILPRSIDNMVGQEMLGVWDFAWSIVGSFHLLEFGVSSSVNRFVAKHLAEKDPVALNRTMSSVFCIQAIVALVMLIVTISVVIALPSIWGTRLGPLVGDAQWVIFFLGLAMAVGFGFGGFAGVLTGFQRWGLYNCIASGSQLLALVCAAIGLATFARADASVLTLSIGADERHFTAAGSSGRRHMSARRVVGQ